VAVPMTYPVPPPGPWPSNLELGCIGPTHGDGALHIPRPPLHDRCAFPTTSTTPPFPPHAHPLLGYKPAVCDVRNSSMSSNKSFGPLLIVVFEVCICSLTSANEEGIVSSCSMFVVYPRGIYPMCCRLHPRLERHSREEDAEGEYETKLCVRYTRIMGFPQQLNRINVSIFTPSLLFSKVAFFLSPGVL
jgi:hypothetical protein